MKDIITLFSDVELFANAVAEVSIKNVDIKSYDFDDNVVHNHIQVAYSVQFRNLQSAFVSIFKNWLYEDNEWDKSNEPSHTDKEWITALKELWLYDYLKVKRKEYLRLEEVNFSQRMLDFIVNHLPSDYKKKDFEGVKLFHVYHAPECIDDLFFGYSDTIAFLLRIYCLG